MIGKRQRAKRFRYPRSRQGLIVPIDHGLTLGPIDGLGSAREIAKWIRHPAITGVIAHKGMIERLIERDALGTGGVMLHLNGMTSLSASPDRKEMLTHVETAVRSGADGVSIQVNFDGSNDSHNLRLIGEVADSSQRYGIPLLTMLYDKVQACDVVTRVTRLRHLMRACMELGSDALKIAAPSDLTLLPTMFNGIAEDISIFVAGGELCDDELVMELAAETVRCGGAGLCVGRNIFQRENPGEILHRLGLQLRQEITPFRKVEGELREVGIH